MVSSLPSSKAARPPGVSPRRRSAPLKYRNSPCELDGVRFASKLEARRYAELRVLERAGDISGLTVQPRFPLRVGNELVCTYVADFSYRDKAGALVVEDCKSPATRTAVYKIKARLLRILHHVHVTELAR